MNKKLIKKKMQLKFHFEKFFCFLILTLLSITCFAQKEVTNDSIKAIYKSIPKVDGNYEYSEVVVLDSTYRKDILYRNAKLFFTDIFKSSKDVIQYDDKEEGKIIAKGVLSTSGKQGNFLVTSYDTWNLHFSLEIFCKDGKYRYRIYDFSIYAEREVAGTQTSNYSSTISLDEAFEQSQRGFTKKAGRKMFADIITDVKSLTLEIKSYMKKKVKVSNSDF